MKWHEVSALVRADVIEMSHRAKTAHLASALSCVDILTVLYTSIMELNQNSNPKQHHDKFILSKAHASFPLCILLKEKGLNPEIKTHLEIDLKNGIHCTTGSLGHGLPIATGMAFARKKLKELL